MIFVVLKIYCPLISRSETFCDGASPVALGKDAHRADKHLPSERTIPKNKFDPLCFLKKQRFSLCAGVYIFGTLTGTLAGSPFFIDDFKEWVHLIFGAIGGLLAGIVWSAIMMGIIRNGLSTKKCFVRDCVRCGILVGVLATFVLWLPKIDSGLNYLFDTFKAAGVFGLPAGALVGLICGSVWASALGYADAFCEAKDV